MAKTSDFRVGLEYFHATSIHEHLRTVLGKPEPSFEEELYDHARRTPAYQQFLSDHGALLQRLEEVPPTSKSNYIQEFPIEQRCLDGRLADCDMMAVSSGTTGKAVIWPRTMADEIRTSFALERILLKSFECAEKRTLAIVCFPLGIWVGGMYTASAMRMVASKGYPLTVLTPGTNMSEIGRCLAEVAPLYEQTILCGYPPFIRDAVDHLVPKIADPERIRMRILLAGEAISEEWRVDMSAKLQFDILHGCISMYGTADAGILGFETAETIALRRRLSSAPKDVHRLLGLGGMPSIFRYIPDRIFIDEGTAKITFSSLGLHTLFRYDIGDCGTAISAEDLSSRSKGSFDLEGSLLALPFVIQNGRLDHTISFFGGQVYPEHIAAVLDRTQYRKDLTGRFVMLVRHDSSRNRPLQIIVEAKAGVSPSPKLLDEVAETLRGYLESMNSEYANYVPESCRLPEVVAKEHQNAEYFGRGGKQRYIAESSD